MSATDLFNRYYEGLVRSLPMKNVTFLEELKKHNLLSEDVSTTLDSLTTSVDKASYFLDNVIKSELDKKSVESFNRLLNIMTESNLENVAGLSKSIKSELL